MCKICGSFMDTMRDRYSYQSILYAFFRTHDRILWYLAWFWPTQICLCLLDRIDFFCCCLAFVTFFLKVLCFSFLLLHLSFCVQFKIPFESLLHCICLSFFAFFRISFYFRYGMSLFMTRNIQNGFVNVNVYVLMHRMCCMYKFRTDGIDLC